MTPPDDPAATEAALLSAAAAGLSLEELAAKAGLSVGAVRNALRGWRHAPGGGRTPARPTDRAYADIAKALGIPAADVAKIGRRDAAQLMRGDRRLEVQLADVSDEELLAEVARRMAQRRPR